MAWRKPGRAICYLGHKVKASWGGRGRQNHDRKGPELATAKRNEFCEAFVPALDSDACRLKTSQERNSTSSRWNIFTARNSAMAAYIQVERKMSAIECQW